MGLKGIHQRLLTILPLEDFDDYTSIDIEEGLGIPEMYTVECKITSNYTSDPRALGDKREQIKENKRSLQLMWSFTPNTK